MNTATTSNRRSRAASGRLLGVLGLFWLNLVVAPCAFAIGAWHECTHCPPEQAGAMAAQHAHHQDMAATGCDTLTADCDDLGAFAHEARSAQPKLKDKTEPVPMAPPSMPGVALDSVGFVTTTADPPDPDPLFPPIHLLNCVFLD